jgi:hypothetical protein
MNARNRRRIDSTLRTALVAVILSALVGCSPSCVVYQHQEQTTVPCEAKP